VPEDEGLLACNGRPTEVQVVLPRDGGRVRGRGVAAQLLGSVGGSSCPLLTSTASSAAESAATRSYSARLSGGFSGDSSRLARASV